MFKDDDCEKTLLNLRCCHEKSRPKAHHLCLAFSPAEDTLRFHFPIEKSSQLVQISVGRDERSYVSRREITNMKQSDCSKETRPVSVNFESIIDRFNSCKRPWTVERLYSALSDPTIAKTMMIERSRYLFIFLCCWMQIKSLLPQSLY